MLRFRRSEKEEIREHTGDWAGPLSAYPATVAMFFGINGNDAHTGVHDFWPHHRDSW
jgi:hypothetical protein